MEPKLTALASPARVAGHRGLMTSPSAVRTSIAAVSPALVRPVKGAAAAEPVAPALPPPPGGPAQQTKLVGCVKALLQTVESASTVVIRAVLEVDWVWRMIVGFMLDSDPDNALRGALYKLKRRTNTSGKGWALSLAPMIRQALRHFGAEGRAVFGQLSRSEQLELQSPLEREVRSSVRDRSRKSGVQVKSRVMFFPVAGGAMVDGVVTEIDRDADPEQFTIRRWSQAGAASGAGDGEGGEYQ